MGVCVTRSGFTVARRHSVKAGLAFGFRNKLPIQQDKEKKKNQKSTPQIVRCSKVMNMKGMKQFPDSRRPIFHLPPVQLSLNSFLFASVICLLVNLSFLSLPTICRSSVQPGSPADLLHTRAQRYALIFSPHTLLSTPI